MDELLKAKTTDTDGSLGVLETGIGMASEIMFQVAAWNSITGESLSARCGDVIPAEIQFGKRGGIEMHPRVRQKKADESRRLRRLWKCHGVQIGLTFSARGPFGPRPSVYDTRCPSWSCSKLTPSRFDVWKNMSLSLPSSMKPKPLSVSRLIVPSAILSPFPKRCLCGFA